MLVPGSLKINLYKQSVRWLGVSAIDFPYNADVVVCGGGIVGCAVAYLLAKTRIRNVVLVDQHSDPECGATQHCAKFFTHAHPTRAEIKWSTMSRQLYDEVNGIDHHNEGWFSMVSDNFDSSNNPKGSFTIATTPNRAIENKRKNSLLAAANVRSQIIDSYDLAHYFPSVNRDNILNALWVHDDIQMDARKIRRSLLNAAISMGVKFYSDCKVSKVVVGSSKRKNPMVIGVDTKRGFISTPVFVNCAGAWASEIGLSNAQSLNACVGPCLISTMTSKSFSDNEIYPYIWADPDHDTWMLHDGNRIVICGINTGRSINIEDLPKDLSSFGLEVCPDHLQSSLSSTLYRFPQLNNCKIDYITTSMDSFSYDNEITVGELESVINYYVVSGMHAHGLMFAGAAASILQSLLDRNRTQFNLCFINPSRYSFTNDNHVFRHARTSEISSRIFNLRETNRDFKSYQTCRGLRVSPLFDILKSYKAVFGNQCGYEWPLFFDTENSIDVNNLYFANLYREPHYVENVKNEYFKCKESMGISDMSGFVKLLIESSIDDVAEEYLQRLSCTSINTKNMQVSRALMLNRLGTYECDGMVAKLNDNRYMMVAPCTQTTHCIAWLKRQIRHDENIIITDVSSQYGVINLIGPMACKMLELLTGENMSMYNFPSSTIKQLNIDIANDILTMRISYTGGDGFTLFVPSGQMRMLYNRLLNHGKDFGIANVGYLAIRALRIEHGIDYWGSEVSQRVNPLECNKGRLVQMNKEFKGRNALIDTISHGIRQRLVLFRIETNIEDNVWPAEGDPIYEGDTVRGYVSSTVYSHKREKHIVLGFLSYNQFGQLSFDEIKQRKYEIDICGSRFDINPVMRPIDL